MFTYKALTRVKCGGRYYNEGEIVKSENQIKSSALEAVQDVPKAESKKDEPKKPNK